MSDFNNEYDILDDNKNNLLYERILLAEQIAGSQKRLCELAAIHSSQISRFKGDYKGTANLEQKRKSFSIDTLKKLANAIGEDVGFFVDENYRLKNVIDRLNQKALRFNDYAFKQKSVYEVNEPVAKYDYSNSKAKGSYDSFNALSIPRLSYEKSPTNIPLYASRISASPMVREVASDIVDSFLEVGALVDDDLYAVRVYGDSMQPNILENDILVFKAFSMPPSVLLKSAFYVVRMCDDSNDIGLAVKRVIFDEDKGIIVIYSDNSKYAPIIYDLKEINFNPIVGKVTNLYRIF